MNVRLTPAPTVMTLGVIVTPVTGTLSGETVTTAFARWVAPSGSVPSTVNVPALA